MTIRKRYRDCSIVITVQDTVDGPYFHANVFTHPDNVLPTYRSIGTDNLDDALLYATNWIDSYKAELKERKAK